MALNFEGDAERVVGRFSGAERAYIQRAREEQFNNQQFEDLLHAERPKSPAEVQLIALGDDITNAVRHLDTLRNVEIPLQNIHVVREDDWPPEQKGNAFYDSEFKAIVVREQQANIVFLKKIVHEMIHFKSYSAMQMTSSANPELREYRLGLVVHSRDGQVDYFNDLNEAVTEEITKDVITRLKHPLLQGDLAQTSRLASQYPDAITSTGTPLFDDDAFYAYLPDDRTWKDRLGTIVGTQRSHTVAVERFGYAQERNILHQLIDKLFFRNHGRIQIVSEVNEVFRRGMMTGNILPLGRLIDGTFGKGTLRRIGEMDSNIPAQEEFLQSL